ncbi:MAG TPA: hemerythrin family protein [Burkholderiales bacterium]
MKVKPPGPFLEWHDRYAVGIAVIDGQHREMLDLVNRLFAGVQAGGDRDELVETLRELVRATEHNIATEERLMQEHGLALAHHHDEHARLLEAIRRFDVPLDASGLGAMGRFLREWLLGHIDEDDRPFAEQLHSRGVT